MQLRPQDCFAILWALLSERPERAGEDHDGSYACLGPIRAVLGRAIRPDLGVYEVGLGLEVLDRPSMWCLFPYHYRKIDCSSASGCYGLDDESSPASVAALRSTSGYEPDVFRGRYR